MINLYIPVLIKARVGDDDQAMVVGEALIEAVNQIIGEDGMATLVLSPDGLEVMQPGERINFLAPPI